MMEVLTDFATVQYFGVQTVSVGVYTVWKGSYDFDSAVQLAALVMLFAVAVLAGERLMRGRARFTQQGGHGPRAAARAALRPGVALLATAVCLLALAARVFVPVARLVWWAVDHARGDGPPALDSGFVAGVLQLRRGGADRVARPASRSRWSSATRCGSAAAGGPRAAAQLTTFGYAVPGAVIGIGTLLMFAWLDDALEWARRRGRHRPAGHRFGGRHPLRLRRPLPRAGVPGRGRVVPEGAGRR